MPGVLIWENTVRYFALNSGLIFPWFGNIKNLRHCLTNWSYRDVFDHSSGNYYYCIFQVYLTTSWTNLTLHFLTWCNYAAQLHPSLGKVKGKGKFLLNSKWKNYFHGLDIFKVLNWLMSQYRKTIVAEFFFSKHIHQF